LWRLSVLACGLHQLTRRIPDGGLLVVIYGQQAMVIAEVIERYVTEHPRAADTAEGIRTWWVARERYGDSLEAVQQALDYLTEAGRLCVATLPDGTAIYARAAPRSEGEKE
jgi:hypothetical protein